MQTQIPLLGAVSHVTFLARLFILLSGVARIREPYSFHEFWIRPGGLIVAADIESDGHYTFYPSDVESVALQIPFNNGTLPEHDVLWQGPCSASSPHIVSETRSAVAQQESSIERQIWFKEQEVMQPFLA